MPTKDSRLELRIILKIKIMSELLNRYQQVERDSPFLLGYIQELEAMLKALL